MDSSSRVEGGLVGLTPEQLIQEFISLRIDRWRSKKKDVPDQELAAHLFAMSWDYDSLPPEGPGCIMAGGSTGHIYIPYDDSRSGLPPEIEARIDMVDQWLGDPANAPVLRGMDQIMRRQIDDYCFSEFLEGGNASRVDFLGKIKILARYRLMEGVPAADVSPHNPYRPQFRMIVVDINEFGHAKVEWRDLDWYCTEAKVVEALENFSDPKFCHEEVLARLLRHLDVIHDPEVLSQKAQSLIEKFKSQGPIKNNPEWKYLLCDDSDLATPLETQEWTLLKRSPNVIKMMKRESREANKSAVIIRSSLLQHYLRCHEVHTLQQGQRKYHEENRPCLGEGYFNGG